MKKIKKYALQTVVLVGVITIAALPTMLLWNWLVPEIFNLSEIDFLQSLGIMVLARLIFGVANNSKN